VRDDPRHDRLEVSPFGEDRSPLDDCAAGGMRSAQSRHQGANRVVVHLPTVALPEVVVPIVVQPQRLLEAPHTYGADHLHIRVRQDTAGEVDELFVQSRSVARASRSG
jgi:hypothetical protein